MKDQFLKFRVDVLRCPHCRRRTRIKYCVPREIFTSAKVLHVRNKYIDLHNKVILKCDTQALLRVKIKIIVYSYIIITKSRAVHER